MANPDFDLQRLLGDLTVLRAEATSPALGYASLDRARNFQRVVAAVADTPTATADESSAMSQDWVATKLDGQVLIVGPGIFLLSDSDASSLSLLCDEISWTIVAVDETGDTVGDGNSALVGSASWTGGNTRVTVAAQGTIVSDWTFAPDGSGVDHLDTSHAGARLEKAVKDAVEQAIDAEVAVFEAAQNSSLATDPTLGSAEPRATSDPSSAPPPVSPSSGRSASSALLAVAGILSPGIANPATAWSPTHTVGLVPLEVGAVPSGRLTPGTTLAAGLDVRLVETTPEGWALVECSNEWRCYVPAWGLAPIQSPTARPRRDAVD